MHKISKFNYQNVGLVNVMIGFSMFCITNNVCLDIMPQQEGRLTVIETYCYLNRDVHNIH